MLRFKIGEVPALIDTGAQFSCIRTEVLEYLFLRGQPCKFSLCSLSYTLADGTRHRIRDAVNLHVKLLGFAWDHELKVLGGGPFPVILGLDFLCRTRMLIEVSSKQYRFGFAPDRCGTFGRTEATQEVEPYLQSLEAGISQAIGGLENSSIFADFPHLFSST